MSDQKASGPEPRLSAYLIVQGAPRAIEFYTRVFGAKELYRLTEPTGRVGHAELEIGGTRLMLADEYPDFGALSPPSVGGSPVSLHFMVGDVDQVVAQAVEHGATLIRQVKDEFHGYRSGIVADPFGHRWHLATLIETVSPEEMQRRWTAMFEA
jgi:PhnB protein